MSISAERMRRTARPSERLACSRFVFGKRAANRLAKRWLELGGKRIVTTAGKQRGLYRVRAMMHLADFAKFCAEEAREQAKT